MLFYAGFGDDVCPLLIDANDANHAASIAADIAHETPHRVIPIPAGVFAAQLFMIDEDGRETTIDPLEHVVDYLDRLDAIDGEPQAVSCGAEAESDDDEIVTCQLPPHAEGEHFATTLEGKEMRWSAS